MVDSLGAGWYNGKGAKETVVGCVKRVWVLVVACGAFLPLPTNAFVACRLMRWKSAMGLRLGAGDNDNSEFKSRVDMDAVEKGVGRQACGIIPSTTESAFWEVLVNDKNWVESGSKRSVSSAAETSDVNSAIENGGGSDGELFVVVVVVAVDILLNSGGSVKNDDDFFALPIY